MIKELIDAAICRRQCDLALKNCRIVNVFGGDIIEGDVGICNGVIVGIGSYSGEEEIDLGGKYLMPSFIDAHVHVESSKLTPEGFATLVVPRGTTTVIADPHEITNVCGLWGAKYVRESLLALPIDVKLMLPSCVPATPFETSGAEVSAYDVSEFMGDSWIFGLGEFMNYPAVIAGEEEAVSKLESAYAAGKVVDGHAPSLTGNALNAYICGGVSTDHECAEEEEIKQKLERGMYVMLRHGSSAHDLERNCKFVTAANMRRFVICTDDRHAADIKNRGHIDDALRCAVRAGVDPVAAVTMATLNAAECYSLRGRGGVAPGYAADLCVADDLQNFNITLVIKGGKVVARGGEALFDGRPVVPSYVLDTVNVKKLTAADFAINLRTPKARAIEVREGSLVTDCSIENVVRTQGDVTVKGSPLLKLAVIERHGKNGNIGLGLLKGYGFKGGALAVTIAHDSHNLIVAGDDNQAMADAANALKACGGGMAIAVTDGEVKVVPLEVGGLMTAADPDDFIRECGALYSLGYEMGVKRGLDVFLTLAFMSLAVIPHIKLLDTGLFDVDAFAFTDINAD